MYIVYEVIMSICQRNNIYALSQIYQQWEWNRKLGDNLLESVNILYCITLNFRDTEIS